MTTETNDRLITDITDIVSSYVSKNAVPIADLPKLISTVHEALAGLGVTAPASVAQTEQPTAAQVKKSITPDALISFLNGKPYKTLKRHLTHHGLDPKAYRARFGLPADYPMTSPSYSAQRSELVRSLSFGRGGQRQAA